MARRAILLAVSVLLFNLSLLAQVVLATVPVGRSPGAIAADSATNKIYVVNQCGDDPACQSHATVTVIDGVSLATASVSVGSEPYSGAAAIAINHATNRIYVPSCGDAQCNGILTIINGTTLATTSVSVGIRPVSVAVNEATNKIYVVNACGTDPGCSHGTLSVIDGATLSVASVDVGPGNSDPTLAIYAKVAVDTQRNRVYVTNPSCSSFGRLVHGSVTVVNGVTLATSTVQVGEGPVALAVNQVTNKIYVANGGVDDNSLAIIDGATLTTSTVPLPEYAPMDVAVNAVTNQIYVGQQAIASVMDGSTLQVTPFLIASAPRMIIDSVRNKIYAPTTESNSLYVVDGVTLARTKLPAGSAPPDAAINQETNTIYVANFCATSQGCSYGSPGSVSVVDGTPLPPLQFVPVSPCRVADTRVNGQPIQGGTAQDFAVPQLGGCGIPANAGAYSFNVTMVPPGGQYVGYLSIYPTGGSQPVVSLMNSWDGRIKANAAIVPAGTAGSVSVYASNTTDVALDIDGYFIAPGASTLAFYPLPPCRVADTRWQNGQLGGPYLGAGQQRDFPVQQSACGIPASASAYSLNFTAIPRNGPVFVFKAWPAGQSQPATSILNAPTGTVVANAAIVPAGAPGDIDVWASNDSDLAIDVNGYFAAPGNGGLSLYDVPPCRVLDTRAGNGMPFSGTLTPPVHVTNTRCGLSTAAQAFVFNATVVPAAPLGYLTLWPDGQGRPTISTLNALDQAVTSNMAIVPSSNGSIDAYAAGLTHLILDISGYFAP